MEVVKAFNYNKLHTEIIIKGTHENPLFRASDIGEILEIVNIRASISGFDNTERDDVDTIDVIGRTQNTTFLTEKGLYKYIFDFNIIYMSNIKSIPYPKYSYNHKTDNMNLDSGSYNFIKIFARNGLIF